MAPASKSSQTTTLFKECRILWRHYGGWQAFFCSPFLWLGLASAVAMSLWSGSGWSWYKSALGVLPNLLGFSLGGYAVMLAFGNKKFLDAIRGAAPGGSGNGSPYMSVSASLAYFVIAQTLTLVIAITYDGLNVGCAVLNFLGCWIYIYSILLGLAATLRIFFLSRMFDLMPKDTGDSE